MSTSAECMTVYACKVSGSTMQAGPQATQLFKFEQSGGAGSWERYSASVSWDFVNINEDSRNLAAKWQLEAGELETEVRQRFDAMSELSHAHPPCPGRALVALACSMPWNTIAGAQ